MAYFPMFVELEGRPCLIVGGGAVALRKARKLLPYGPCLTVVAQSFVPELEALEGAVLCRRAFRPRDVEGQALVVADGWNGIFEYLAARRAPVRASVPDETARARLFAALFDACMEKGRPLEQAEFDALAARMEREGPGNA